MRRSVLRVNGQRWSGLRWFAGVLAGMVVGLPVAAQSLADGRVLAVGPTRELHTVAEAAAVARDGDVVEIDAGDYSGDVAVWKQDRILVRGVGGRVRLIAAGASAERKGIWVVRGGSMTVENVDFIGARVPDRNGAGIRFEKGRLTVRNCSFIDNENGILAANDKDAVLTVEGSEFGNNGAGDGQSHNLYAGGIGELSVMGSYFHHAHVGHLLKSRAARSYIAYNRLSDETGGQASYELEFPSGGVAIVIGNIIQQGATTQNPFVVSFGAEGYRWPVNELYLVHNTLIDDRPSGGQLLRVRPGAGRLVAVNNLSLSRSALDEAGPGEFAGNLKAGRDDFVAADSYDYRLRRKIGHAAKLAPLPLFEDVTLMPGREYVHPRKTRRLGAPATVQGALQSRLP
jgi:hypothetical protein